MGPWRASEVLGSSKLGSLAFHDAGDLEMIRPARHQPFPECRDGTWLGFKIASSAVWLAKTRYLEADGLMGRLLVYPFFCPPRRCPAKKSTFSVSF